uniref:Uncharacterized protein n=1 Tax=Siphoviridae sp. ctMOb8 TaxID=2825460 RepID=A0A8S5PZS5_9CAUD|nr:MAG TPA: hypothetical protein [Siphoviridae sp. ctMOb8]
MTAKVKELNQKNRFHPRRQKRPNFCYTLQKYG